jgi:hypothetical protein
MGGYSKNTALRELLDEAAMSNAALASAETGRGRALPTAAA